MLFYSLATISSRVSLSLLSATRNPNDSVIFKKYILKYCAILVLSAIFFENDFFSSNETLVVKGIIFWGGAPFTGGQCWRLEGHLNPEFHVKKGPANLSLHSYMFCCYQCSGVEEGDAGGGVQPPSCDKRGAQPPTL